MNIHELTISEAKERLQKKEFSAVELAKACLARIKEVEPKLQAFTSITEEKAIADAKRADQLLATNDQKPLLGIPFSIKDNFNTEGIRTTASSKVLDDYIPPYNATVVNKLYDAGITLVGKTNMDAWAHGSSTETSDYFTTKNPWDTSRLPGGSSGGAAASMAADEVLAAIGSETAGSIRLPAA